MINESKLGGHTNKIIILARVRLVNGGTVIFGEIKTIGNTLRYQVSLTEDWKKNMVVIWKVLGREKDEIHKLL